MSFSVSFLCVCVCAHRSSATCDDLVCVLCASCLFFRKTKSKRNGVDTSLLPPIFFFLPAALKKFSFSFCLSLYAIAVHHTQSFSACSIYNNVFSMLCFEDCNLTLRSSGQAVLSVDAAIKKTLCSGSAEFRCPHAAPPSPSLLPAVVPVRMKALDALWSVCPSSNLGANDCTRWWWGCNAFLPPAPASQDSCS